MKTVEKLRERIEQSQDETKGVIGILNVKKNQEAIMEALIELLEVKNVSANSCVIKSLPLQKPPYKCPSDNCCYPNCKCEWEL